MARIRSSTVAGTNIVAVGAEAFVVDPELRDNIGFFRIDPSLLRPSASPESPPSPVGADGRKRNAGELIASQDWNASMDDLVHLDEVKVNRTGAETMTGPLVLGSTSAADAGAGRLTVNGGVALQGNNLYLRNRKSPQGSQTWGWVVATDSGRLSWGQATDTPPSSGSLVQTHIQIEPRRGASSDLPSIIIEASGLVNFPHGIRSSDKSGYVVDYFLNEADEPLRPGDILVCSNTPPSLRYGPQEQIPVPNAILADGPYDHRVCGVVAVPSFKDADIFSDEPALRDQRHRIGSMVTLGCYACCRVDADIAPVNPGDLLTTSPTRGHAQSVTDRSMALGAILGKALGSVRNGRSVIPILVTLL